MDGFHLSATGVVYTLDIVVHFLRALSGVIHNEGRHSDGTSPNADGTSPMAILERRIFAAMDEPSKYEPMHADLETPITWACCPMDKDMPRRLHGLGFDVETSTGWSYRADSKVKYGYITRDSGAEGEWMSVVWRTERERWDAVDHIGKDVFIAVGYLITYNKVMGSSHISCVQGCSCEPVDVSAYWTRTESTNSLAMLRMEFTRELGSHIECGIRIVVDKGPNGGSKFKVTGFYVIENKFGESLRSILPGYTSIKLIPKSTMQPLQV